MGQGSKAGQEPQAGRNWGGVRNGAGPPGSVCSQCCRGRSSRAAARPGTASSSQRPTPALPRRRRWAAPGGNWGERKRKKRTNENKTRTEMGGGGGEGRRGTCGGQQSPSTPRHHISSQQGLRVVIGTAWHQGMGRYAWAVRGFNPVFCPFSGAKIPARGNLSQKLAKVNILSPSTPPFPTPPFPISKS